MFDGDDYKFWYEQYFPMIRKLVLDMTGSSENAEDIFQDTLVIAFENLNSNQIKLTAKISTYLYGIAKNKCRELIRKQSKMNEKSFDETTSEIPDETGINETEYGRQLTALRNCIAQLSGTGKKIITAYYYGKMSMMEIAEKYSLKNAGSVKSQKHRAIQNLRTCIELTAQKQNRLNIW